MQSSFDLTTIVFIGLAIFVAWRLRSVLGQRTGAERPPEVLTRRDPQGPERADGNVVRLPGAERPAAEPPAGERWAGFAEPGSPLAQGLDAVAAADPGFDARQFVEGAKMAYEMIVTSFAQGDRKVLKDLLARDVYDGFDRAISEREKAGHKAQTTFVSIDEARITAAELRAKQVQITVRFASSLISSTVDAGGNVVEGSTDKVANVNDIWTFARMAGTRDPNWQLIATESEQ